VKPGGVRPPRRPGASMENGSKRCMDFTRISDLQSNLTYMLLAQGMGLSSSSK